MTGMVRDSAVLACRSCGHPWDHHPEVLAAFELGDVPKRGNVYCGSCGQRCLRL